MGFCGDGCVKGKRKYLENLRKVNLDAGVEPEVVELLEAYARLRIDKNLPVTFYDSNLKIRGRGIPAFLNANSHLDLRSRNFLASYFVLMQDRGLKTILNQTHLESILKVSSTELQWLINPQKHHYTEFNIKKSDGSNRKISAPRGLLKQVQRSVLDEILVKVSLSDHAEGFRQGRSILSNSQRHVGKKTIVNIDIKDFFPSIGYERVLGLFLALGYPYKVSALLSNLTTHKNCLPTGAPTSPVISNIVCRRLDTRLSKLGNKMEFDYSRYADDITFSSDRHNVPKLIPFINEIINSEGFRIKEAKTRVCRSGGCQEVTGVVVNSKASVGRAEYRKLRAIINNCRKRDLQEEIKKYALLEKNIPEYGSFSVDRFKHSIIGRISFLKMIDRKMGESLMMDYRNIKFPS